MFQIANRLSCRLSRSVLNSTLRNNTSVSALSVNYRYKSTNSTKNSLNPQQAALKLDPVEECPPKPPNAPPPSNFTKWIVIGGAIATGAGYLIYNSKSSEDTKTDCKKKADKGIETQRSPPTTKDIPKHVPYLLIGGGTASFAAFRAIKSNEPKAKVLVISDEFVMPYMRPPLSKEIWFDAQLGVEQARFKQWNGAERSLYYEPVDFYLSAEKLGDAKNGGVSVIRGYSVVKLNVAEQKVLLDDGTELTYDKCLIATGSSPKKIDIFEQAPAKIKDKIHSFKSIKDFEAVKCRVENSKSVAIIGNGFLGSELACALAHYGQNGKLKVYQLFHEAGSMAKVLPEYLSKWTTERVREVGVDVQPNSQIVDVDVFEKNQLKLKMKDGKSIIVDCVIQAVGSNPNVGLAQAAGLETDPSIGGFVVNAELEARSNLYAAGDVACFYDQKLGRRRVEHHDHAVVSGRLAGENMVGLKKPYKHQSMFWSDLGSVVGYEAIGMVDASLPTIAVFAKLDPNDEKRKPYDDGTKPDEKNAAVKSEEKGAEVKPAKKPEAKPDKPEDKSEKNAEPSLPAQNIKITTKNCPPGSTELNPENYGKGVVFYMQGDKIVGILLWNVFNRISIARKVLMSDETFTDLNEVAKLFDIFEQQTQDKQN